jgi:hypothetical protein
MASERVPRLVALEVATGGPRANPARAVTLIAQMATANPIWGKERIASEPLLELGLLVSPRTIGVTCRDV